MVVVVIIASDNDDKNPCMMTQDVHYTVVWVGRLEKGVLELQEPDRSHELRAMTPMPSTNDNDNNGNDNKSVFMCPKCHTHFFPFCLILLVSTV